MQPFRGIAALAVSVLVAGCASTVSGHGTSAGTASAATTTAAPAPTSPPASVSPSDSGGFTPSPPTSAPAETSAAAGASLANALRVIRKHHYSPVDESPPWYPQHTLNGIVGYPSDSADGHAQFVFFFVGNKYIGTDTGDPSTEIQYLGGTDTTVIVKYFLYTSADPLCCPTGGTTSVRYHWTGHKLVPLDPIPPLDGSRHR